MIAKTSISIHEDNLELLTEACQKYGMNAWKLVNTLARAYFIQIQSSDIILEKRTCSYQKLPGEYIIYSIEFAKENFENLHSYRLSRRVSVSGLTGDLICMADFLMEFLDKLVRNGKNGNN